MFVNAEHIANVAKIYQELKDMQAPEKLLSMIRTTLQEMQSYFLGEIENRATKVVREVYVTSGLVHAIKEYRVFYPNVNLSEARKAVENLCCGLTPEQGKAEPPFERCTEVYFCTVVNDDTVIKKITKLADDLKKFIPVNYKLHTDFQLCFYYRYGKCDSEMARRLHEIIAAYLELS